MKQGKQFMKVIMLVLAFMVASYILYHVALVFSKTPRGIVMCEQ